MDRQPNIDRTILLPILIGTLSIFGILIILLMGRLNASRAAGSEAPTETPFRYIFLGTEPLSTIEGTAVTEEPGLFDETSTPFDGLPGTPRPPLTVAFTPSRGTPDATSVLPTNNQPGGPPGGNQTSGPPINNTSPASTGTNLSPNPGSGPPPLNPGEYDDAHPYLAYEGPGWAAQTNVSGAENGTLHVSQATGSTFSFRFIGRQVRLFYLDGQGVITITIDNEPYILNQGDPGNGNEWASPLLANATHTVRVQHTSGGAVNIDLLIIPDVATPTPTPTRTPG